MKANRILNAFLDAIALRRWLIPLSLILLYVIVFSLLYPDFFPTVDTLAAILLEFSIPAILVAGMALQFIIGEIDLSVGYNAMFSNLFVATLIVLGMPVGFAIVLTLAVSSLIGWLVGFLVSRAGVNSFIATLGAGLVFYGLGLVAYSVGSDNTLVAVPGVDMLHLPHVFTAIAKLSVGKFQLPVLYAIVLLVVLSILVAKLRYFRQYYYVGANSEAAALSGIRVPVIKNTVFALSAFFASLAGILIASRMGAATVSLGIGWELKAITACVIGGLSFKGGQGTMGGAVIGSLFTICLQNALRSAEAPSFFYKIIEGLVLIGAVVLDRLLSTRKVVGG